jgi:phosphoenolpyruvate-protein phosphotransferase (PTS system enzyme I)
MDAATTKKEEKHFRGIPVAQGIAHFAAFVQYEQDEEVVPRSITNEELPGEIARFESALIATRVELLEIQKRIVTAIGSKDASLFDAHLLVVEDRMLIDEVLRGLQRDLLNVEFIFQRVANKYCATLGEIDDPYLRERVVDIEDVSRRVLRNLLGKTPLNPATHHQPHIVVAHNLTPSDTAQLNRELVRGFVTEIGSKTSHTAIMARSLEIPAIVGMQGICQEITLGDDILIDGYTGLLVLNPSRETLQEYGRIEQEKEEVSERLSLIRETSSTTRDGKHIVLSANIDLPDELDDFGESGAEGIGLFRTEFLYLNRQDPPDEEEQFHHYCRAAECSLPHSVIIRTLDIGGDKVASSVGVDYDEENPFLGCRAIRFCLDNPSIFKPQLRAILRAAALGNVRLMYPMVSGLGELRRANGILQECREELAAEGVKHHAGLEVGMMVETPSAVLVAEHLAQEVGFFSIGTNDLIQYAIAVDRLNDRIAHLYNPTHPAILRMLKMTVDAGRNNGIWTGICGEMASDILLTPLLIGLGVDELSAIGALVPRVKKAVQSLDAGECAELARIALGMSDSEAILEMSAEMARRNYGELI